MLIDGKFYRNASSSSQLVQLHVDASGFATLKLSNADDRAIPPCCPFTELDISPRLGNTPRYIVFKNGDQFETMDNASVDKLLVSYQRSKVNRLLYQLESRILIVMIAAVLVVVFVWGFSKYGVPVIASYIAGALPAESSQYLGQGAIDIMDKTVFKPSELPSDRKQALTSLFHSYAEAYSDYSFQFSFRKGGNIGANAMALPDGHIIFTDEMVALAEDDNELLAILGHEIGHVVHRHLLRRVIQDSMLTVVLVMITGDVSSASSAVIAMPSILLELAFSREFEREADDFAYEFLIANNIQPVYFADIMQRLTLSQKELAANTKSGVKGRDDKDETLEEFLPYLSTHPAMKQRIQRFKVQTAIQQ